MSVDARQILKEDGHQTIADKSYVGGLIRKWKGFLEGLPVQTESQRYTLGVTAMLMENEATHLKGLNEETRSSNVGSFTKFIFPVLRRVFPNLIANEIVSVQPMSAPVGAIFYLDYVYGSNKGATTAGNVFPRDFDRDYSSEYVNGEPLAMGNAAKYTGAGGALNAVLAWKPVRPLNAAAGYKVIIKEVHKTTGADVQVLTDDGAGAFAGDGTGTINYGNGSVSNVLFTAAPAAGNPIKALYYYDGEFSNQIPQVQLDVKKAAVEATPRRLKALWSSEAAEDLRAMQGIDAETEMVSAVAQEIALEIDREIIQALFAASNGTTTTFDRVPPAGINELDHLRSMLTSVATVSNIIHRKTLRAPANWIVTSPEISALVSQLTTHGDFRPMWMSGPQSPWQNAAEPPMMMAGDPHGQGSIYKVGTLMNRWTVYEDPFFTADFMLLGLKGRNYLDAGACLAPYVPLQVTASFLDPNDMGFRKGLRTRYAFKVLRDQYYGNIRVLNL